MRLLHRASRADDDKSDPVIEAWFARYGHVSELDRNGLERGRRLVTSRLAAAETDAAPSGGLRRRLALAGLGGGSIWASMSSMAAAHPVLAAAAALSVLAGGATAAEVTGVGPAVREAVHIQTPSSSTDATAAATSSLEAISIPEQAAPGAPAIEPAPEGVPGNLVTQLHDNGRFTMRATLDAANSNSISLVAAGGAVELSLDAATDIQIPGNPSELKDLSVYVGQLVFISGTCESAIEVVGPECVVTSVQVLGQAGENPSDAAPGSQQGEHPTGQGRSEGLEQHGKPDHASDPESAGAADSNDGEDSEDAGKPDKSGKPATPHTAE